MAYLLKCVQLSHESNCKVPMYKHQESCLFVVKVRSLMKRRTYSLLLKSMFVIEIFPDKTHYFWRALQAIEVAHPTDTSIPVLRTLRVKSQSMRGLLPERERERERERETNKVPTPPIFASSEANFSKPNMTGPSLCTICLDY